MARFAEVNEIEYDNILKDMNSINTHRVTSVACNIYITYLVEKELSVDLVTVSKKDLNDILKLFYLEVRKADGSFYRKSSLASIRDWVVKKI